MLAGGESVHDAVDGIHRPQGMQGRNHQMARFRRGHSDADGFMVPHFPQQDHVRRLAQGGPQGHGVAFGIDGNFPLADNAFPVAVQIFDGILQRHHMAVPGLVDPVDNTRQGGGFSRTGRPSDHNQALGPIPQLQDNFRNSQPPGIGQAESDDANHRRQRASLAVHADPEPGNPFQRKGKIVVAGFQHVLRASFGEPVQLLYNHFRVLRHQALVRLPLDLVIHFIRNRQACDNKNVRRRIPGRLF